MRDYLWNLLIAIDQLLNAVLGGDPDETISSRMGRWRYLGGWRARIAKPVCWLLNAVDPGHCADSVELDGGQRDLFK